MKKLFRIIGYILLAVMLLSGILLLSARFLAPTIVEKALTRDLEKHGYAAVVDVDVERFNPFGIEIPLVRVDLGGGELELVDLVLDVKSLLSPSPELRMEIGKLKVKLTDGLIGYLEESGVEAGFLPALKGRNISFFLDGPYILADNDDIYLEVDALTLGFRDDSGRDVVLSTDGFRATATTKGTELLVTPIKVFGDGKEFLSFDEGLYSEGNDTLMLGQVTIHSFMGLPEGRIGDLMFRFLNDGIEITSSGMVLSGFEQAGEMFDEVQTESIYMLIGKDERIAVETAMVLSGEGKMLNNLGLEFHLNMSDDRIEVRDGFIFHRKLKGMIPFQIAMDDDAIEVEFAGSRRYTLDRDNPSRTVISEMISFVLMKFASSLFGLGKTHLL